MDRVWAPWRMEYITATKKPGEKKCFLCIEEGQDEESLIIGRLGKAFVIMNRFPYTNGHVMVVPLRHTGLAEDLTDEESLDMMRLVRIIVTVYKEEFKSLESTSFQRGSCRRLGAWRSIYSYIWYRVVRRFNFMAVTG